MSVLGWGLQVAQCGIIIVTFEHSRSGAELGGAGLCCRPVMEL